jgi:hypothetical protein
LFLQKKFCLLVRRCVPNQRTKFFATIRLAKANGLPPLCVFIKAEKKEARMKKLALGVVLAATCLTAVPAMAQVNLYTGPGGVGVQLGAPRYYAYPYRYGSYDYYGGPGFVWGRPGWHSHAWNREHWHR